MQDAEHDQAAGIDSRRYFENHACVASKQDVENAGAISKALRRRKEFCDRTDSGKFNSYISVDYVVSVRTASR